MQVRFFYPGKTYLVHKTEFDAEIQRVLAAGDLILRADVKKFEENLADFVGKKYAVALNSGTDALYLSLWALGIGLGDEVIVPAHTFVATIQVIVQLKAMPILTDLKEDWLRFKTLKTKAIIPAHIAGEVLPWIPDKDVVMIDDACQALGALGASWGIIQCYSFYPAKILGAFGDAGAITTNDRNLAEEIRELRNHYKKDYSKWGINSRMDNLQAAVLNVRFKYLPEILVKRKQIAELYLKELNEVIGLPDNYPNRVWQDFVVQSNYRDELYEFLKKEGVETMKNEYPMALSKPPKVKEFETCSLRLPCNENLEDSEVYYVIQKIKEFYDRK